MKRGLPRAEAEKKAEQISQFFDALFQTHLRQQPSRFAWTKPLEWRPRARTEAQDEANEWEAIRRVIAAVLDSELGPSGATAGQQKAPEQQKRRNGPPSPKSPNSGKKPD